MCSFSIWYLCKCLYPNRCNISSIALEIICAKYVGIILSYSPILNLSDVSHHVGKGWEDQSKQERQNDMWTREGWKLSHPENGQFFGWFHPFTKLNVLIKVAKGGEFKANKKDENENIQYYAGSENQLSMTRYMMVMMLVMEMRMVKIWR